MREINHYHTSNYHSSYRGSRHRRRKRRQYRKYLSAAILILLVAVIAGGGFYVTRLLFFQPDGNSIMAQASDKMKHLMGKGKSPDNDALPADVTTDESTEESTQEPTADEQSQSGGLSSLLAQANALAAGYDYDAAISLLQSNEAYASDPQVTEAIAGFEAAKASCRRVGLSEITHVFFHTLVMDNSKAFDGDYRTAGYNQVMTTKSEFLKILEEMYKRGYVLVRLTDTAKVVNDENGGYRMEKGNIMLPPDKKAFVMSQDDVCYYRYMEGDGFATRMIVGEDGKPTCEMLMDDGTVSVGSYDLVPILEDFIQEHPDFSYRGARAIIAFTGYDGILGYRTAASDQGSPTYEQDRAEAARVAQCLRDNGWELASHSWGHRNMGKISMDEFRADTDKWENEVESLIGPTDIILFPFGSDVGEWQGYSSDNERYQYLRSKGFRYFCNVDSNQYWFQLTDEYLRQGRRNLDGYRMYYDIVEPDPSKRKLTDLFNPEEVFDPDRPTPVPPMGGGSTSETAVATD